MPDDPPDDGGNPPGEEEPPEDPGGDPPKDPPPTLDAPPIDPTVATNTFDSTAFLYSGTDPVQTGVAPGTIEPRRAAVIAGRVIDRDGKPIPNVAVTVLDHDEYGQTLSRSDGRYDLAVNGGGLLTIELAEDDHITAQRQVQVPWGDYAAVDDVVLVAFDPVVTNVDLSGAATEYQVAAGSEVIDDDGTRQGVAVFAPGTTATMTLPDGTQQPVTDGAVRITEFTAGERGPEAMPGELPPTSAYTYAAEFSLDEAVAAGATRVDFSQPVAAHVDNFLGFPDLGELVGVEAQGKATLNYCTGGAW